MKILIVDNGTSYISELENLCSEHDFTTIETFKIETVNTDDFDAIVLSGGHDFPVDGNEDKLIQEIDLIKNCSCPVFAICFGFEIVARTFGAELKEMRSEEKGILEIEIIQSDKIFENIPNLQVYESHRWVIKETPDELTALARSKDGIEAIKHRSKPIYAVQFHPEMFCDKCCGDEIFRNFLNMANN